MNYVGKVFSSVRGYIGINPATLTGAIDVIVIRQDDGSYISSPWHVRFGKMGVIRAKQKVVDIEINGEPVDLHMKLGEAGEAFFVEEAEDIAEVPPHLATSPLQTNSLDLMERGLLEMKELAINDQQSELLTPIVEDGGMVIMMEGNSPVVSVLPKLHLAKSLPETNCFAMALSDNNCQRKQKKHEASTQTDMTGSDVDVQKCQLLEDPVLEENVRFHTVMSSVELSIGEPLCESQDLPGMIRAKSAEFEDPMPRKIFSLDPDSIDAVVDYSEVVTHTEMSWKKNGNIMKSKEKALKNGESVDDFQFEIELDELDPDVDSTALGRHATVPLLSGSSFEHEKPEMRNQFVSIYQSFSDTDLTPTASPSGSRPSSPKSDTELEISRNDATAQTHLTGDKLMQMDDLLWKWGQFPESSSVYGKSSIRKETTSKEATEKQNVTSKLPSGGIYLEDLRQENMDPELYGLYLYDYKSQPKAIEEDRESGRGVSLPQSPVTVQMDSHDNTACDVMRTEQGINNLDAAMSLCGCLEELEGEVLANKFQQHLISFETFCNNPNILSDPNLMMRISGKYYKWQVAGPMIMSLLMFNKPLTQRALDTLLKQHMPKKEQRKRGWLWWGNRETAASLQGPEKSESAVLKDAATSTQSSQAPSPPNTPGKTKNLSNEITRSGDAITTIEATKSVEGKAESELATKEKYKKSLKLSSEQIAKLNLNDGLNEVTFSVTTQYQGTARCMCYLFLWNWNDKIVVSDIDGTITRSDVLGQVLPMIGQVLPYINDWSQVGIAKLYSMISSNGYKFLYLSARAIGQSKLTRDYLRSIRQGDISLPDGPLLLSPSSLVSAFHKEVIERKPEEFKISCLKDIKELFPSSINPFLAGFGNRINDVWAYTTIGIPRSRIFTVNHKGQLRIETLQSFESSYTRLSDVVDHFFPPLDSRMQARQLPYVNEFNSFNYWKNTLPDIESELNEFVVSAAAAAADKKQDKKGKPSKK